jgi:hypothetical protein
MMERFDLYGWRRSVHLLDVVQALGSSLQEEFELHENSDTGEYYLNRDRRSERIRITMNVEDEEGTPLEPEFPDYEILVYVSKPPSEIVSRLGTVSGLDLLRSEML